MSLAEWNKMLTEQTFSRLSIFSSFCPWRSSSYTCEVITYHIILCSAVPFRSVQVLGSVMPRWNRILLPHDRNRDEGTMATRFVICVINKTITARHLKVQVLVNDHCTICSKPAALWRNRARWREPLRGVTTLRKVCTYDRQMQRNSIIFCYRLSLQVSIGGVQRWAGIPGSD